MSQFIHRFSCKASACLLFGLLRRTGFLRVFVSCRTVKFFLTVAVGSVLSCLPLFSLYFSNVKRERSMASCSFRFRIPLCGSSVRYSATWMPARPSSSSSICSVFFPGADKVPSVPCGWAGICRALVQRLPAAADRNEKRASSDKNRYCQP